MQTFIDELIYSEDFDQRVGMARLLRTISNHHAAFMDTSYFIKEKRHTAKGRA